MAVQGVRFNVEEDAKYLYGYIWGVLLFILGLELEVTAIVGQGGLDLALGMGSHPVQRLDALVHHGV